MPLCVLTFVLASLLCIVTAHQQQGLKHTVSCDSGAIPPFQSYHIHVLFWQSNRNSTSAALELQEKFFFKFGLTRPVDLCPFEPGGTEPDASLCYFETDFHPAGPFLTAQTAWFIPVEMYEEAVSWTLKNKGSLDVFVHPNSGCGLQDHTDYALWGGNKWEVDSSVFTS